MNNALRGALALAGLALATQAAAGIMFYENEQFQGRTFSSERPVTDFSRYGFNDRASSAVVLGERWEVCEHAAFGGRCTVLRPGRYSSLAALGLNDRVSSARMVSRTARVDDGRYAPPAMTVYDNRRRGNERLYTANVTSVREVMAENEKRCWIEREHGREGANVPGAVIGAVIGGVLGHQIGNGRGNDVATVGGAVAGGAVGSQVGRGDGRGQDVQRCASAPGQARTDHWDVTYNFRGTEHRIQMTSAPGHTISVNERGEPRA